MTGLPGWPFALPFAGYGAGWFLGLGDIIWILAAGLMALALGHARGVRAPKGFGLWLLFLVWMVLSATQVDSGSRLIGFAYRALLYCSATVIFLYAYNVRALTARYISGALTTLWVTTIVGGYAGVLAPLAQFRTPLSYVVPSGLQANELVHDMVVRSVSQYNPDAWNPIDPRPSAPFLYTNNWGNAYSLLLPFVITYLLHVRGTRRFWWLLLCLPLSFVPAALTLNRGMFIALGVGTMFLVARAVLLNSGKVLLVLGLVGSLGGLALVPVLDRLAARLSTSGTTQDRLSLYLETIDRTLDSPLLGYGAPRPSSQPYLESAGTQGQVWMVLFAHGVVGLTVFMCWYALVVLRGLQRTDVDGLALSAVPVMAAVQTIFYGNLATGLVVFMVAAAYLMRGSQATTAPPVGSGHPDDRRRA